MTAAVMGVAAMEAAATEGTEEVVAAAGLQLVQSQREARRQDHLCRLLRQEGMHERFVTNCPKVLKGDTLLFY